MNDIESLAKKYFEEEAAKKWEKPPYGCWSLFAAPAFALLAFLFVGYLIEIEAPDGLIFPLLFVGIPGGVVMILYHYQVRVPRKPGTRSSARTLASAWPPTPTAIQCSCKKFTTTP